MHNILLLFSILWLVKPAQEKKTSQLSLLMQQCTHMHWQHTSVWWISAGAIKCNRPSLTWSVFQYLRSHIQALLQFTFQLDKSHFKGTGVYNIIANEQHNVIMYPHHSNIKAHLITAIILSWIVLHTDNTCTTVQDYTGRVAIVSHVHTKLCKGIFCILVTQR